MIRNDVLMIYNDTPHSQSWDAASALPCSEINNTEYILNILNTN